jgi:RNA polymerase sigma-70 factor (ECF subfamily)
MVIDGIDVPEDGTEPVDHVGELLQRVARGDQGAFARVYDLISPRVFGLILRVLVDRAQSEEVLQEGGNPPRDSLRTEAREGPGC